MKHSYAVCGCKSWNKRIFDTTIRKLPGTWVFIASKDELTAGTLGKINPRYIFFLHWSWKVPAGIIQQFECVNFHMTDVPYGRGGSPLQNLILRGHKDTKLSALRMTDMMDAGPVYLKEHLGLEGTAQEILERSSEIAAGMIEKIIAGNIQPVAQRGDSVAFHRRKPEESRIPSGLSAAQLYDFIRMLDGEGYPPAFVKSGGFRYEFTNAVLHDASVEARVQIIPDTSS